MRCRAFCPRSSTSSHNGSSRAGRALRPPPSLAAQTRKRATGCCLQSAACCAARTRPCCALRCRRSSATRRTGFGACLTRSGASWASLCMTPLASTSPRSTSAGSGGGAPTWGTSAIWPWRPAAGGACACLIRASATWRADGRHARGRDTLTNVVPSRGGLPHAI